MIYKNELLIIIHGPFDTLLKHKELEKDDICSGYWFYNQIP